MRPIGRPEKRVLSALLVAALALPACASSASRARGSAGVLRLGLFPAFTHAPGEVGLGSGIFQRVLAPTRVEVHVFNSGTDAGVALLSGSIDASYLGPWPAASLYLRSGKVAVVSGSTIGGVRFVVRAGEGIRSAQDLQGKRIAVPNVGNSQDIALRTWLHANGLSATDEGGNVSITQADGAELLELFRAGRLDGAWFPEPYPTFLIHEGVAAQLVDEASLWADGRFSTADLVVSTGYMSAHPDVVRRLVEANVRTIEFIDGQPLRAQAIATKRLVWAGGPELSPDVVQEAWSRLSFTWDPLPRSLLNVTEDAFALGMLPSRPSGVLGIFRLDDLQGVLDDEGLPPIEEPK
jgi:NitT/TauT family transport system substrate-binding protein